MPRDGGQSDLFVSNGASKDASQQARDSCSAAPEYRGKPLARREHILEKHREGMSPLDILEDSPERLVVRWRAFGTTDHWILRDGSNGWFELDQRTYEKAAR